MGAYNAVKAFFCTQMYADVCKKMAITLDNSRLLF